MQNYLLIFHHGTKADVDRTIVRFIDKTSVDLDITQIVQTAVKDGDDEKVTTVTDTVGCLDYLCIQRSAHC